MPEIALLWDTKLLFEKFFVEHGFNHRLVHPSSIGSPFLPEFNMILIPTGFANPKYSTVLPFLVRHKHRIWSFIEKGGILVVFGALTDTHSYEWLPVEIKYVQRYGPVELSRAAPGGASMLAADTYQECDGFFQTADGEWVILNDNEEPVLVRIGHGSGQIIATTIHEFPTPEFIRWGLDNSNPAHL